MSGLKIEGLAGGYGALQVFAGVSFEVGPENTVGILGPNGAGKTTLLKTVVGLLPPMAGQVTLGDVDLTREPAYAHARAGIALVPEGRQILATLTLRDNLALTRAAGPGRDPAVFKTQFDEVMHLFPRLQERLDQQAGSLSGGEQQMLAIARALMIRPRVLMLDEPTQGLAPVIIRGLADTLSALKGRFAIILVEQNRAFLERLTDQVLVMRNGRIEPRG
jgi:ABC-type branched-subunit amino acid transport system ATPase component